MYDETNTPQFIMHRNRAWTLPTLDEAQTALDALLEQSAEPHYSQDPEWDMVVPYSPKCLEYRCETEHYHDIEVGIMGITAIIEPCTFFSIL